MLNSLMIVAVASLVTIVIRFLPFWIFNKDSKLPESVSYLGSVLPGAIMAMLVVYCFKSTVVLSYPYAIPEIIATIMVVVSYLLKRNTLVSIVLGTVIYVLLVQFIFV